MNDQIVNEALLILKDLIDIRQVKFTVADFGASLIYQEDNKVFNINLDLAPFTIVNNPQKHLINQLGEAVFKLKNQVLKYRNEKE
jgi:hypothetical protein